jgi:hypothetical protein
VPTLQLPRAASGASEAAPQRALSPQPSGALSGAGSGGVDARSWGVAFGDVTIIKPIGEGSFGRVSLGCGCCLTVGRFDQ